MMIDEEERNFGAADLVAVLKRRRWQFLLPAIGIVLASVVVAFLIPSSYLSQATILIEQQEIPQDLVRSTVTSYADKRVQTISQRVMTTSNLGEIIGKYDLYEGERERFALATVVEKMREDIELRMVNAEVVDPRSGRPVEATIAFTLAYYNESPVKAQRVANELVSLFLNENVKERRELAQEATSFLSEESEKLAELIGSLETEIEAFKAQYSDSLPEMQSLNLQFMQRNEEELRRNDQDLRALDERIIYLEAEIAQINPYSELYSETGERILSAQDRLKTLESSYITLAARYSADHPDVIAAERELEALRRETGGGADAADLQRALAELRGKRAALSERYVADHPDIVSIEREIGLLQVRLASLPARGVNTASNDGADNPVFIQLQARLQAARTESASLRKTRVELQRDIEDLKQRIVQAPRVEREYRTLLRDYDNATLKFNEVRNKQLEAQLAESLEAKSKSERFVLIEPPQRPEEPDSPNRLAIILLGFILALGGGGGYAALRESSDDSVHDLRDLAEVLGTAPLGAVAYLETRADILRQRWRTFGYAAGFLLLVGAVLAALHMLYLPLDVLSIKVMRQLGV